MTLHRLHWLILASPATGTPGPTTPPHPAVTMSTTATPTATRTYTTPAAAGEDDEQKSAATLLGLVLGDGVVAVCTRAS